MAKKEKAAATEGAEAAPAEKASRGIILNIDGRQVSRSAYIKELFATGNYTRGEIVKIINDLGQCNTIPYQIVFAATKGMEGKKVERKVKAEKPAKEEKAA